MVCIALGCEANPPANGPAKSYETLERMTQEAQWDEAIPEWRRFLLDHPENSGAHFYLGRCYLNSETARWRLPLAEGEFETALALFLRQGKQSPIEGFSARYFAFRCHIEAVKVCFEQMLFLLDTDIPNDLKNGYLQGLLAKCEEAYKKAEAIVPDSPDLINAARMLEQARIAARQLKTDRPTPTTTSGPRYHI